MNITDPIYSDDDKARGHLESLQWPNGPFCPHCGNADPKRITKLQGKSTRPGVYKCKGCRKPFSVTVGTLMERSHIPLTKWLLAMHLMTSSKKGMSAHQLHRMMGITYESAWFLAIVSAKPCAIRTPVPSVDRTRSLRRTKLSSAARQRTALTRRNRRRKKPSCRWSNAMAKCAPITSPTSPPKRCARPAAIVPFVGNETPASADCDIKGNISVDTGERIYHVPGQRFYKADHSHRS